MDFLPLLRQQIFNFQLLFGATAKYLSWASAGANPPDTVLPERVRPLSGLRQWFALVPASTSALEAGARIDSGPGKAAWRRARSVHAQWGPEPGECSEPSNGPQRPRGAGA